MTPNGSDTPQKREMKIACRELKTRSSSSRAQAAELARQLRSCSPNAVRRSYSGRAARILEALADRIARAGGEAAYARTDVKRRTDVSDLVKLACERYGKLDVLVNNAGIGPISPLDDLRVEEWEEMIDINIKGVL